MDSGRDRLAQAAFWCAFGSAAVTIVSIAVSQILLGGALACLLLRRGPFRFPPILLPLCLFATWTVLSLFLSGDPRSGFPQIKKFFVYLILLVVASTFSQMRQAGWLALAWFGFGCAAASRSLFQFGQKWLAAGPDFYQEYVGQRITGFMSHWMTFSGLMMVVFLVSLAFLLWRRPIEYQRLLTIGALVLTGSAIALAYTRGVWVGTAAAAVFLLWSWRKAAVLVLPVAAGVILTANPGGIRTRFLSFAKPRGELDSNQHRMITWRTGLAMVRAHPWFGVGPEQVGVQFKRYVPADIPQPLPEGWYGHLHNNYLHYAAERGVPAVLILFWMFGRILADWVRLPRSWLRQAGIAGLIGILVAGLSEVNLGDSEVLLLCLALIAVVYACAGTVRPPEQPAPDLT